MSPLRSSHSDVAVWHFISTSTTASRPPEISWNVCNGWGADVANPGRLGDLHAMQPTNGAYWTTDEELFLACQGGRAVADWFGFVPSFHDATLDRIELAGGNALLAFRTFRMTDEVDAEGFFLLDRHAVVTVREIAGFLAAGVGWAIVNSFAGRAD